MTDKTLIGIIMGSDSDMPVMQGAVDICRKFGIPFEVKVISAHRTPDLLAEWAKGAAERGLMVIIAGAGGAAHLPGVTAAHTHLPVIGVPVKGKALEGMDSLLSIVQMPPGVPVATVGVNGAKNAALLAVQIIGVADAEIAEKMKAYKDEIAEQSKKKNDTLKY